MNSTGNDAGMSSAQLEMVRESAGRLRALPEKLDARSLSDETLQDILNVVAAYLFDHQSDDDEPITADWLHGSGFLPEDPGPNRLWAMKIWEKGQSEDDGIEPAMHLAWGSDDGSWWIESYDSRGDTLCLIELVPDMKTRGDVRRICTALGIKLSADLLCPTCNGPGKVAQFIEGHGAELVGCPDCAGTGKKGGGA